MDESSIISTFFLNAELSFTFPGSGVIVKFAYVRILVYISVLVLFSKWWWVHIYLLWGVFELKCCKPCLFNGYMDILFGFACVQNKANNSTTAQLNHELILVFITVQKVSLQSIHSLFYLILTMGSYGDWSRTASKQKLESIMAELIVYSGKGWICRKKCMENFDKWS